MCWSMGQTFYFPTQYFCFFSFFTTQLNARSLRQSKHKWQKNRLYVEKKWNKLKKNEKKNKGKKWTKTAHIRSHWFCFGCPFKWRYFFGFLTPKNVRKEKTTNQIKIKVCFMCTIECCLSKIGLNLYDISKTTKKKTILRILNAM